MLLLVMVGCREHVYHTYYGDIDIDTMEVAFYEIKDSLPCYLVHVSDLDSVEKSPRVWGYIYGPLKYYYCPAKDTYYHTFPDNQGNAVLRGYDPYKDYSYSHEEKLTSINENDIFTVVYRQPVNGYKVKAVVKMSPYDNNCAEITFTKNGKSFTLSTISYGDSLFNKGGWGMDETNEDIMKKYCNKTVEADYHSTKVDWKYEQDETPFFFKDMDFDGVDELVIVHYRVAVRYHDGYDVYRIVDGEPVLINYPPYKTEEYFGMTDYPEFDYKNKTISCPYPEGPGGLPYIGQIIYGISKRQKDTVVVNGRKHLFNHIEKIKEIKFD